MNVFTSKISIQNIAIVTFLTSFLLIYFPAYGAKERCTTEQGKEYYKIHRSEHYGIEDSKGKTVIPLSIKATDITLWDDNDNSILYFVVTNEDGDKSLYNFNGDCIIPFSHGAKDIRYAAGKAPDVTLFITSSEKYEGLMGVRPFPCNGIYVPTGEKIIDGEYDNYRSIRHKDILLFFELTDGMTHEIFTPNANTLYRTNYETRLLNIHKRGTDPYYCCLVGNKGTVESELRDVTGRQILKSAGILSASSFMDLSTDKDYFEFNDDDETYIYDFNGRLITSGFYVEKEYIGGGLSCFIRHFRKNGQTYEEIITVNGRVVCTVPFDESSLHYQDNYLSISTDRYDENVEISDFDNTLTVTASIFEDDGTYCYSPMNSKFSYYIIDSYGSDETFVGSTHSDTDATDTYYNFNESLYYHENNGEGGLSILGIVFLTIIGLSFIISIIWGIKHPSQVDRKDNKSTLIICIIICILGCVAFYFDYFHEPKKTKGDSSWTFEAIDYVVDADGDWDTDQQYNVSFEARPSDKLWWGEGKPSRDAKSGYKKTSEKVTLGGYEYSIYKKSASEFVFDKQKGWCRKKGR